QAIDGDTAAQWGLANRAVASDEVDAEAWAAARLLATRPRQSLTATKRLMRDHTAISAQIEQEMIEFAARLASPEAREAFQAFAERRAPDFANV
ncbi:enoyl-CoA hydratase-related protein, partial [Phenylobacterium sp.]|uniref:enoyl-CoA hydratase-related protein n=1 Tax=Phenylobacterium sp. TaxID=1871053 RepID=UPI002ED8B226